MKFVTTALGAGSYPEPPAPKEVLAPACRYCGSEEGPFTKGLCAPCLWKTVLWPNRALAPRYVGASPAREADFYLSFLFRALPQGAQIAAVRRHFAAHGGLLPYGEYLWETQQEFWAYLQTEGYSA